MNIGEWVEQFPPGHRKKERERIAQELGVSEMAVRSWCTGDRAVRGTTLPALEKATEGGYRHYSESAPFVRGLVGVSRYDQRPDIFGGEPVRAA